MGKIQKIPSFFFRELQLSTVLLLICDSYMSWSTRLVSIKLCVKFSIFDSVSFLLTLSWRRPLSYKNHYIDLRSKSMDWFLYGNGLRHERVKIYIFVQQIAWTSWLLNIIIPFKIKMTGKPHKLLLLDLLFLSCKKKF